MVNNDIKVLSRPETKKIIAIIAIINIKRNVAISF